MERNDGVLARFNSVSDVPANRTVVTDWIEVAHIDGAATGSLPYSL